MYSPINAKNVEWFDQEIDQKEKSNVNEKAALHQIDASQIEACIKVAYSIITKILKSCTIKFSF